jgi:hypothetical protein
MANVVTYIGLGLITGRIKGTASEPHYVGWGTGAGTAGQSDTTLFTEADSRTSGSSSQQTTSQANDTYQVMGTMTAGTNETITNVGLFDANISGNLFVKANFTGLPLSSGDSLALTFRVVFS